MANWCSNWVTLSGEPENVKAYMNDIKALHDESVRTGHGVKAVEDETGEYMFDLYVDECGFSFESKWSPVFASLRYLSAKHGVTTTNIYEEGGCMVYGQWTSDGINETDVFLEPEEWNLAIPGNEDCEYYIYNGVEYDSQSEVLQEILENKLKLQNS